jgi:hypothetical protein
LGAAAVAAAGFVPWRVTAHAEWLCRRLGPPVAGLKVTPGEARWIPWSGLELSNLEVETRGGGRLRFEEVEVRPRLWMLARGQWVTLWRFGEVRVDPDSWGIRQQPASEILSAGPAVAGGLALVRIERDRWIVKQMSLRGPLLWLKAEGWFAQRGEGELVLRGELLGRLLPGEGFGLWEPFDLQVRGRGPTPEIRFTSNFFTFSMNPQPERRP